MTNPFWKQVRIVFDTAMEQPPDHRAAAIAAMLDVDAAVKHEASLLLDTDADGFLDHGPAFPAVVAPEFGGHPIIAGYRITRSVGRGGMGEVFEAVRIDADYTKRFAIKILRPGMFAALSVERFERERRILARLEHRNIASLIDGGVTSDGRPFLVMEFVEGVRITDWCTQQRLDLWARLQLFRQTCGAVSYAHRNLVVHRDIKPANILVTGDGTVKLLDFGIAKVLDEEVAGDDASTRPEAVALTPEYAAPEQLDGAAITTATDVFSLGLLLFELLTGGRPFANAPMPLRALREQIGAGPAPAPSSRVTGGRGGGSVPPVTAHQLRGDLDAIVTHALRPQPTERYGTVDEMVDDLRRHESGMPVAAMRGRTGYRMRKFLGRNRAPLAAAALVVLAATAGIVATLRQSDRASAERRRAEATTSFLTSMLRAVDPSEAGRGVLMTEVLDSAASRIDHDRSIQPAVEMAVRTAIGASYSSLGEYDRAEAHLRRVIALGAAHPEERPVLESAWHNLASVYDGRGEYPRADSAYRQALALLPDKEDSDATTEEFTLRDQLARMQGHAGKFPEAAASLQQLLVRRRAYAGPGSFGEAENLGDLTVVQMQMAQYAAAEVSIRKSIAEFRALNPRPTPQLGQAIGRLASALEQQGKAVAADSAYRQSLAIASATQGATHPDVTWIRYNYAAFLADQHRYGDALLQSDSVLMLRGTVLPESHPTVGGTLQVRAQARAALGDTAGAEADLRESLAVRRKYLPQGHWMIGSSASILGAQLAAQRKVSEADPLLQEGCRLIGSALGKENPQWNKAVSRWEEVHGNRNCG